MLKERKRNKTTSLVFVVVWICGCASTPSEQEDAQKVEQETMTETLSTPIDEFNPDQGARQFVDSLVRGDLAEAVKPFSAQMKTGLSEEQLAGLWQGLQDQAGTFQKITQIEVIDKDGFRIAVTTTQFAVTSLNLLITFDTSNQIAGFFVQPVPVESSPPNYADPSKFTERELVIGEGDWSLPATLTLPSTPGAAYPAVVLVHGSGPQDRDGTVGGTKVFRDMAWGLASRGIAVLRFEKRTRHHASRFTPDVLSAHTMRQESVEDPLLAATLLRGIKEIDPAQIYVVGHSQGGSAIPRIARGDKEIAGFVIMAGRTQAWPDLVLAQMEYILGLDGISSQDEAVLATLRQQVERARALQPGDTASPNELPLGVTTAFLLDIKAHPHHEMLLGEERPLLVLQGERDYQVTMVDFAGWKKLLEKHPAATFQSYPKANHLFVEGEGPSVPAEYQQKGHIALQVIDDIANWINKK